MSSFKAELFKQVSQLLRRGISPSWEGHHVKHGDLAAAAVAIDAERVFIPWGFVAQEKVLESVTPTRVAVGGSTDSERIEKRAERLNVDTFEFLRGAEEAYRCTARMFALPPPPLPQGALADRGDGAAGRVTNGASRGGSVCDCRSGSGVSDDEGCRKVPQVEGENVGVGMTNFLEFNVASPQMSMFMNDVLEYYRVQGLVPRLSVSSVDAKLCKVGVRLGWISKNTNFMGMMSAEEVKYHLTMGMLGPEGAVINELEGRAPQRVIADVELTCEEEFVLEDNEGNVVYRPESRGPKVHYLTLQSNIGEGTDLEWQITNINDVINPTFSYYFARFGH